MLRKYLIITSLVLATMSFTEFNSYAAVELREISSSLLEGGIWKTYTKQLYYEEGLLDGWNTDENNGKTVYIKNGWPITGLQNIEGKYYLFDSNGLLINEGTEEYTEYMQLLEEMNKIKSSNDTSWKYDCSAITEGEQKNLLYNYCVKYIPGTVDIEKSGFKIVNNILTLDILSDKYSSEEYTFNFYKKFNGIEDLTDREKVRKIHDEIVNYFDYDYTLQNSSDELDIAFENNNKIICGGYAGIFKQVCNYYGIECEVVTGYGNGIEHAWNKVKLGSDWKYIDCCWDDSSGTDEWYLRDKEYFDYTHREA